LDKETLLLQEIRDIRDEISMIESVLYRQKIVYDGIISWAQPNVEKVLKDDTSILNLCERMNRLDKDAERVENSVCGLPRLSN
jgi:hypothetical protein